MSLHHIELHHFKKHSDLSVNFGDGLTGITGSNFAGKSTLLKGILFSLFGVSATGHKSERLTTRGSSDTTKVTAEITLPVHGKVKIERTLKGAKAWSEDGTLLANGTTPVTKLVEEAYGMAAADLQLLLYSKQGQSQALLEFGAAALQQTVERLAKSELVDKVLDRISQDVSKLSGELDGLGDPGDIHELKRQLEHWTLQVSGQEASLDDLKTALLKAREEDKSLRARYEAAVDQSIRRQKFESTIESCTQKIEQTACEVMEISTTLQGLPEDIEQNLELESSNMDSLQITWTTRRSRADSVDGCLARVESWGQAVEKYEAELAQSLEVFERLSKAEEVLTRLQESDTLATSQLNAAGTAVSQAKDAVDKGVCRECKRPFSEEEQQQANQRLEAALQEYQTAHSVWQKWQDPLKEAGAEAAALREAYKPGCAELLQNAKSALEEAKAELGTSLSGFESIAALKAAAEESREQMEATKLRWTELSKASERKRGLIASRDSLEEKVQAYRREYQHAKESLASLAEAEDLAGLRESLSTNATSLDSLTAVETRVTEELFQAKTALSFVMKAHKDCEQIGVRKLSLESQISCRKRLQTWLRKSRAELMSELWDGMLNYASHLISVTTSNELSRVYRQDGELTVDERGEAVPVSELSGFQRSLVGLALRVAMSRVFYGGDHMLLLDEPTADANDENAARVAGMLQGLGTQVIFVSHREGDSVNAGNIIRL